MNQKVKKANTYQSSNRFALNRERKIARHLRKHPNDAQAQVALETKVSEPTRKAPKEKLGWLTSNKSLGESIKSKFIGSITKDEAKRWATFTKLSKKVMFWKTPVVTFNAEGESHLAMKHVNKSSNFKGRITAKIASLKANASTAA